MPNHQQNPYMVRTQHLNNLPRDMQLLVLKHTAASFVLEHRSREQPAFIMLPNDLYWPYYVPVIVRYEFSLLPRTGSDPEMTARFILSLDSTEMKKLQAWRYISDAHKAIFDRPGAYMAREFEPFSQLRFNSFNSDKLFCFLRTGQNTEVAPSWSRFDDSVLTEVRGKMQTEFGLPLEQL